MASVSITQRSLRNGLSPIAKHPLPGPTGPPERVPAPAAPGGRLGFPSRPYVTHRPAPPGPAFPRPRTAGSPGHVTPTRPAPVAPGDLTPPRAPYRNPPSLGPRTRGAGTPRGPVRPIAPPPKLQMTAGAANRLRRDEGPDGALPETGAGRAGDRRCRRQPMT